MSITLKNEERKLKEMNCRYGIFISKNQTNKRMALKDPWTQVTVALKILVQRIRTVKWGQSQLCP